MQELSEWKRGGAEKICLNALEGTVAAAVGSTLAEVEGRADTLADATMSAITEDGFEEFA